MIESSVHPSEPVTLPVRPLGHVVRSVIGYGALIALMIVITLPIFVPAALFHCALRNGRRAAWISLAIAAAFTLFTLGTASTPPDAAKMMFSYVAGVFLAIGLPSMMAVPLVERSEPFGRVLVLLVIASAVGLALTEVGAQSLASFSPYAAHVDQARELAAKFVESYRAAGMPSNAVAFVARWGTYYSNVLIPAALLFNAVLSFVLSLLMIGRLRAWREHVVQQGGETGAYLFRNFALPDWVLFAFVLGGLAPLATGVIQQVAANVLMLVVFLYVLQGFALFRFLLAAVGVGFLGAMFASGFALITGIGPLLLGVAGLFDPFFDFRHTKKRKDDSHESHSD